MEKLFIYGLVCANGTYQNKPYQSTGTMKDIDQLCKRLFAAREYIAQHPDETPPKGTLREAVLYGAVVWCRDPETNRTGSFRFDPPKSKTTTTPQTTPPQPQPDEPKTEQTTETPKTHKKTQDTTEKRFKRIFAELARIKEDLADLHMKR